MIAKVQLWGRTIGAVSLVEGREVATFQYDPKFAKSGIELSPLTLPLGERVYEFPSLPRNAFHGLPGLLADSLPDKFGKALIDACDRDARDIEHSRELPGRQRGGLPHFNHAVNERAKAVGVSYPAERLHQAV